MPQLARHLVAAAPAALCFSETPLHGLAAFGGNVKLNQSSRGHPAAHVFTKHLRQVISLGTHVISLEWPKPMMVFEVMPSVLAKRTFPPLASERMLVPGYRDSPDPGQDMAIVYIKVGTAAACCHPLLCRTACHTPTWCRRQSSVGCCHLSTRQSASLGVPDA